MYTLKHPFEFVVRIPLCGKSRRGPDIQANDILVEFRVNSRSIAISVKTRNLPPSLPLFLPLSLVLSLFGVRFLLFRIPGRRRTHFWPRLVLEARRGQRSGKRLSLQHRHYDITRARRLNIPVRLVVLARLRSTYTRSASLSFAPYPSVSIELAWLIISPASSNTRSSCFYALTAMSFVFLGRPPGRFPRSISSLTNNGGSIRRIRLCFCFSLDFHSCYSGLWHLLERHWGTTLNWIVFFFFIL